MTGKIIMQNVVFTWLVHRYLTYILYQDYIIFNNVYLVIIPSVCSAMLS